MTSQFLGMRIRDPSAATVAGMCVGAVLTVVFRIGPDLGIIPTEARGGLDIGMGIFTLSIVGPFENRGVRLFLLTIAIIHFVYGFIRLAAAMLG